MTIFLKESIKSILNIILDSECLLLKTGLRNASDYATDNNEDDMKNKCIGLIECHEECISKHQKELSIRLLNI